MGNVLSAVLMYALEAAWVFQRFLDQDYRQNHGSRVMPLPSETEVADVFLPNGASTPILSRSPHHHSKPARRVGHMKTRSEPIATLLPRLARDRTRRRSSSFRTRRRPTSNNSDGPSENRLNVGNEGSQRRSSVTTDSTDADEIDLVNRIEMVHRKDLFRPHRRREVHDEAVNVLPSNSMDWQIQSRLAFSDTSEQASKNNDNVQASTNTTEWVSRHSSVHRGPRFSGLRRAYSDINLTSSPHLTTTSEQVMHQMVVPRGCPPLQTSV